MSKHTTKECHNCGSTELIHIETQQVKLCTCCFIGDGKPENKGKPTIIPWFKDEGQPGYST